MIPEQICLRRVDTRRTAFGGAVRGADLVHLADAFCGRSDVLPLAESRPGHRKSRVLNLSGEWTTHLAETTYTTSELAQIEADLMACAVADAPAPVVDEAVVEDVLHQRVELNAEQRQMVRAVCGTPTAIRSVVGYPGSGKTYATEAVVAVLVDSGIPVLGCAVTAEASDELARQTGLATRRGSLGCDTIAKVLGDLDHPEFGGLPSGTVVLVDEASTVSHRDLHRLAGHAQRAGGALVLIGDPHQHSAVGPGNFFRWLVQQGATATLVSNNRQRDVIDDDGAMVVSLAEERKANVEFRDGQVASSLARRDADGKVTRADTAAELYDRVVDDWFADWQQGGRDPMIATRNEVRAQLSTRARSRLAATGFLQGEAIDIGGQPLQVGDVIVTRKNNRRLRSTADPAWFVKNGSRGTVVGIDSESGDLTVRFDGHALTHDVVLPHRWAAATTDGTSHVEYGYAVTDYGVQGRTLDVARSIIDDSTSAAGAYVATTRGRYANRLYLVEGRQGDRGLDADTTHDVEANSADRNLDHVAARLADREAGALIHEMDPRVTEAGRLALTSTLQELEARLGGVERRLAAAPPDVSRRITGAERRLDELTTRRRARSSGLTFGERFELDAQISTLQGRLAELGTAQDDHDAYRCAHEQVYDRRDLLRAAVEARSTRVRLTAPGSLDRILPEEDDHLDRSARAERRGALEELALWSDRQGLPPGHVLSITDLLGPRPTTPDQRDQWTRAADAARHVDPRAVDLVPELAPDLTPPL